MQRQFLVAGAAALMLAACGQPPEGKETTPDSKAAATIPTPANEAAAPDFVEKAALGDMFELAAAKIASEKSKNPEVKKFAAMMTEAHTKTSAALKAAVAGSGQAIAIPAALTADQQEKLKKLEATSAEEFDEEYLEGQVSAHQDMLNLMARYAQDGKVEPIKTFAIDTKDGVQAHLDTVQSLERNLKK